METTTVSWGYMRIMGKKIETAIVYWGYMEIMEKKMEVTAPNTIFLIRGTHKPLTVGAPQPALN